MYKRLVVLFLLVIATIVLKNIDEKQVEHYPEKIEVLNPVVNSSEPSQIKKLYNENNQLFGWLKIDGTKIDYPVMYSGDDYYLNYDFYHNEYEYGSLFIDKNNHISPRDINLIIHGHNTLDGTMFGDLKKYKDYNFYLEHKIIELETLDNKEKYEIVAVFLSRVYYTTDNVFKYYKFHNSENEDDYNNFISNIKKLSLYNTKIVPTFPQKLITLSTCDDSLDNGRLVLVARLIE